MPATALIDVLCEKGKPTGKQLSAAEVHKRGLRHAEVELYVLDGRGHILQSFRQMRHEPPRAKVWNVRAATAHVLTKESPLEALCREVADWIGANATLKQLFSRNLRPLSLEPVATEYPVSDPSLPGGGYTHKVFSHSYAVVIPDFHQLGIQNSRHRKYRLDQLAEDLGRPTWSHDFCQHAVSSFGMAALRGKIFHRA